MIWNYIDDYFTGIFSVINLNHTLRRSEYLDLTTAPMSAVDGWSLNFAGIPSYGSYASSVIDFNYDVRLQIGFRLNENDVITSLNMIIEDVENIITNSIDTNNYAGMFSQILLSSLTIPKQEQGYIIYEPIFLITGRKILNA